MFGNSPRQILAAIGLATLALAVTQLFVGSPVAAQRAAIDPATLLPTVDDLPARFVNRPLPQESTEEPRVRLALRMFERSNPGSPPSVTRLVVTAAVATDPATAAGVLGTMRAQLEGRGWSFQRSTGLIADEAIVGRLVVGGRTSRPVERVMVLFRRGPATGSADWEDFADLPNGDSALSVARFIEARINAAALEVAPPPEPIRRGIGPSAAAPRMPPRAPAPTSIPTSTATPLPTSTPIVIRQLPR